MKSPLIVSLAVLLSLGLAIGGEAKADDYGSGLNNPHPYGTSCTGCQGGHPEPDLTVERDDSWGTYDELIAEDALDWIL